MAQRDFAIAPYKASWLLASYNELPAGLIVPRIEFASLKPSKGESTAGGDPAAKALHELQQRSQCSALLCKRLGPGTPRQTHQ